MDITQARNCTRKAGVLVDRLWRTHRSRLVRHARHLAHGETDLADDLVQMTMVKLLAYLNDPERPVRDLPGLAHTTLRHVACDMWRARQREGRHLICVGPDGQDIPCPATEVERLAIIRQTLMHMRAWAEAHGTASAHLFHMRFIEQQTYPDIAAALGVSEPSARKRVQALRDRLKKTDASAERATEFTKAVDGRPSSKGPATGRKAPCTRHSQG